MGRIQNSEVRIQKSSVATLAIGFRILYSEFRILTSNDSPVRLFKSKRDWAAWLDKNHRTSTGLWLRLAKKSSDLRSVTYKEALEVALCYGWIDGQKKPESDAAWLQRFLPRGSKSLWSKINRETALARISHM